MLIGIGAATAAVGVGKGIKAVLDNSEAGRVNLSANNTLNNAKNALEYARVKSGEGLAALGAKKLFVLDKSIGRFISSFEKLKNVELKNSEGINELARFRIDKQTFDELKEMRNFVSSIISGTAGGALGGALTAFGAYSAAAMFASASTGTAIATLSGAAATNATLAFFGGGALAVGGLGMAGGAVVLGGLVAGPALAIMGFVMGAKASANLDNAYSNLSQAQKMAKELQLAAAACNGIRRRSFLFERLLIRLDCMFVPLVIRMEEIIKNKGVDYSQFDTDEKKPVAAAVSLASAIKALLDTPILNEAGELTPESEASAKHIKQTIEVGGSVDNTDRNIVNDVVYCTNCGKKFSLDADFCTECGEKLKK
jgi:hypothetical protein